MPVRLPLDAEGAEILLVTPNADFFASPHMEGLIGYAKALHGAGIPWTFSSHASEAANFGMFIASHENMQKVAQRGIVRLNSILPAGAPALEGAPLFLLRNRRHARRDSTPKITYTNLP